MKIVNMNRKVIPVLLTLLLILLGTTSVFADTSKLLDIKGNAQEGILQKWVNNNYINGYPNNTFKPENPITRAEFAALINRAFKIYEPAETNFRDVKKADWYYDDIGKAFKSGYLQGNNGMMNPQDNVSRQELALVSMRLGKLEISTDQAIINTLHDKNLIPDWSRDAVNTSLKNNIFSSFITTEFRPYQQVTRAETVVVLDRILNITNIPNEAVPPTMIPASLGSGGNLEIKTPVITGTMTLVGEALGVRSYQVLMTNVAPEDVTEVLVNNASKNFEIISGTIRFNSSIAVTSLQIVALGQTINISTQ